MDVKIISKTEKPLLERTEIIGEVGFEAVTPSRADVRKKLASALNVAEDLIVVTHITPIFGERKSKLAVNIYKKKEDLQKCEDPVAKRRNFPPADAKAKKETKQPEVKETKAPEAKTPDKVPEKKAADAKTHDNKAPEKAPDTNAADTKAEGK